MLRLVLSALAFVHMAAASIAQQAAETTDRSAVTGEMDRQAQQSVCLLVESAAQANELPLEFFVRLIWQESRFRPAAIGPPTRTGKRALGIAQFMPATAAERDLLDPFNPIEALPKAAEFLKDLRDEFGSLALAAAAYNAGPGRVRAWMAGAASMPAQTRAYVLSVTGIPVDDWATGRNVKLNTESKNSCSAVMAKFTQPPATFLRALQQGVETGTHRPWGAILGANRSRSEILDRYAVLQRRFSVALSGRDPIVVEHARGGLPRYQVRVGAESRKTANDICKSIHAAGGDCIVLRNSSS